eukprot:1122854-Prorocentrum_minimum.AAC.2
MHSKHPTGVVSRQAGCQLWCPGSPAPPDPPDEGGTDLLPDRSEGGVPWPDRSEGGVPWPDTSEGGVPWPDRSEGGVPRRVRRRRMGPAKKDFSLKTHLFDNYKVIDPYADPLTLRNPSLAPPAPGDVVIPVHLESIPATPARNPGIADLEAAKVSRNCSTRRPQTWPLRP